MKRRVILLLFASALAAGCGRFGTETVQVQPGQVFVCEPGKRYELCMGPYLDFSSVYPQPEIVYMYPGKEGPRLQYGRRYVMVFADMWQFVVKVRPGEVFTCKKDKAYLLTPGIPLDFSNENPQPEVVYHMPDAKLDLKPGKKYVLLWDRRCEDYEILCKEPVYVLPGQPFTFDSSKAYVLSPGPTITDYSVYEKKPKVTVWEKGVRTKFIEGETYALLPNYEKMQFWKRYRLVPELNRQQTERVPGQPLYVQPGHAPQEGYVPVPQQYVPPTGPVYTPPPPPPQPAHTQPPPPQPREVTCPTCGGMGKFLCKPCNGSGYVFCRQCNGSGKSGASCPRCGGSGKAPLNHNCDVCGGSGHPICPYCLGRGRSPCNACGSTQFSPNGWIRCTRCNGTGKITINR